MTDVHNTSRGYGPGNTVFFEQDNQIKVAKWNDPACISRLDLDLDAPIRGWRLVTTLQWAYERGREEQREIIRNALGIRQRG